MPKKTKKPKPKEYTVTVLRRCQVDYSAELTVTALSPEEAKTIARGKVQDLLYEQIASETTSLEFESEEIDEG